MEMACEEARQAGWVVWWRCAGTSGESVDQEAEQSGAGGSGKQNMSMRHSPDREKHWSTREISTLENA